MVCWGVFRPSKIIGGGGGGGGGGRPSPPSLILQKYVLLLYLVKVHEKLRRMRLPSNFLSKFGFQHPSLE